MADFEIDRGIEVPAQRKRGRPNVFPFGEMDVGSSFFVHDARVPNVRSAVGAWKRNHPGYDYITRKTNGGIRIWRTA